MMVIRLKKIFVGFVLASLLASVPVHAVLNKNLIRAEQATAVLRGMGSAVEYSAKDDLSKNGNAKRALVSLMRVAHGGLVLYNHSTDFNQYHMAWLAVDSVQLLARLGKIFSLKTGETDFDDEAFFFDDQPEMQEEIEEEEAKEEEDDEETEAADIVKINKLRVVVFPALETLAGLAIATYTDQSQSSKKIRFAAQAVMSLMRLSQHIFDTEDRARKVLIAALVLHVGHMLYEILYEKSELNEWLGFHKQLEEKETKPVKKGDGQIQIIIGDAEPLDICLICRKQWQPGMSVAVTKCKHVCCTDCLGKWLKYNKKCFMCTGKCDQSGLFIHDLPTDKQIKKLQNTIKAKTKVLELVTKKNDGEKIKKATEDLQQKRDELEKLTRLKIT